MSDYLEEGVLINILLRLPIKNLVQCTAVCKSWYALIRSPFFISTHLNLNSSKERLLLRYFPDEEAMWNNNFDAMKKEEKYYLLNNHNLFLFDKYTEFEFPFDCIGCCYRIVGCCNGVLCLTEDSDSSSGVMILWNPTIRKSVLLPEPNLQLKADSISGLALGFGFDPQQNDYKAVRFAHSSYGSKGPGAEIYELSKNAWRDISHLAPPYGVESVVSAYFEGAGHWVARNKEEEKFLILAFDMSKEVFSEIPLPENMVNDILGIEAVLVYKESLSVTIANRSDNNNFIWAVWVMKDYGDPSSWTKLFSVICFWGFDRILGFTKSGQALFVTHYDGCHRLFDLKSLLVRFRGIYGYIREQDNNVHAFNATAYVETLVLLDRGEDGSYANTSKALRVKKTHQLGN